MTNDNILLCDNKLDLINTLASNKIEPITMEIDNEDYIYLTNTNKCLIDKFNKDGEYVSTYVLPETSEAQLFIAVDIVCEATDPDLNDEEDIETNLFEELLTFFIPKRRILSY